MKTFPRGGVHPSDNKLSRAEAVEVLALPDVVNVPLSQHIGAPAVAKVAKGDKVKVGELIAEAAGFVSANIHAPVSGTVTGVDMLPNGQGIRQMMITIRREGDEWAEGIDTSKELVRECTLSAPEILARIKEAGIVGMGGAAFPTQVKLTVPAGKKVEHLIINGVECEPYLTSDHRVMLERSEELLVGVTILMRALGVSGASIGIENNKPDAIARLSRLAPSYPGIRVVPLRVRYPQGGEKQLIAAVTGREVPPPPGLPIDVGAVVCNVSTTVAVVGCGAEEQTFDRAGGDCYGPPDGGSEKSARPFRNAGGCPVGGCGRRAGRGCESAQRRADDGTGDEQPRLTGGQRLFGYYGARGGGSPAWSGELLYQMRQMRVGLPDGIGALSDGQTLAPQAVGAARGGVGDQLHRVRLLSVYLSGGYSAAGLYPNGKTGGRGVDPCPRRRPCN